MLFNLILFALSAILTILTLSSLALAQEVIIFGRRFSFLLIAPIIGMLVFLTIFVLIVLKDILKGKYGLMKKHISSKIEEIKPLAEKKPKSKERKVKEEKEESTMDYLSEISLLKKEISSLSTQEVYKRLMNIIRTSFSELLEIDSTFTFEELEKELSKKYKNIIFSSKNLSELCYNSKEMSKKQLLDVLNEFENIVKNILAAEEIITEKPKFKGKLDNFLYKIEEIKKRRELKKELKRTEKERKKCEKELLKRKRTLEKKGMVQKKVKESGKNALIAQEDKLKIMSLINEGKKIVKKDIKKANNIYEQIYNLYQNLSVNDKRGLYSKVMKFYNKIKQGFENLLKEFD